LAVKKEFFPSPQEKKHSPKSFDDPLLEDKNLKSKGLVCKYPRRAMIELTLSCASYCRFCTRRRKVSDLAQLILNDFKKIIKYIKANPEINEVIFSGGDPLMVPDLLIYALKEISKCKQIKIVRVHTRIPVSNPHFLSKKILKAFSKIIEKKPLYVSIHFEHPDELTPLTIKSIRALRRTGAILLSQSVFLKGVNDSYKTLKDLFTRLVEFGVKPYYIYRCDLVRGVEHFIVPFKKEVKIMTKLRRNISGLACPLYVIDTPNGAGKIPIPLNFWQFSQKNFKDFKNKKIKMY